MDFIKKFEKQNKINESLFNNLFSKNKLNTGQTQQSQQLDTSKKYGYYKFGKNFIFGKNSIAEQVNGNSYSTDAFLQSLNIPKNPNLNFLVLPGTNFHAKILNIDPQLEEIALFVGEWNSGSFKGKTFNGIFRGNSFEGNFKGSYKDYQPGIGKEIISFVDGTFTDYSDKGILGMQNTLSINKNFNFITIPVGYYLQFKSVNGIKSYIKVLKRLDGINSYFSYEILNGFIGQKTPKNIFLDWQYFRQNAHSGIFDIDLKKIKNIAGLIQIPEGDSIKEIYVSIAPASFENISTKQFEPNKQYIFNLSRLPYLNIKSLRGNFGKFISPEVKFSFDSSDELENFNKIISYIDSNILKQDIKNVARAIKYGEVDGYGPFNYLNFVFNNNLGKNIFTLIPKNKNLKLKEANKPFKLPKPVKNNSGIMNNPSFDIKSIPQTKDINIPQYTEEKRDLDQDILSSMGRLNDFVKFFVENITDKKIQDLIISRLKTALGTQIITSNDSQPGMSESIRIKIKNLIYDNFETF